MFLSEPEFERIAGGRFRISCGGDRPTEELSVAEALQVGQRLLVELGIDASERVVLLLLPHSQELFCLHLALAFDHHVPAILPWPTSRVDPEKYQRNLIHQLAGLPAARLITLPQLAENMTSALAFPVTGLHRAALAKFESAFSGRVELTSNNRPVKADAKDLPNDAVFLQFSGGTTGAQKCVVVTAPMLRCQMERLRETMAFTASDTVISWLPLYHDMGLIACLWLPLWCGGTSVHLSASDWLLAPEKLFAFAEEYAATFCWLPNFAFSYLAQRKRGMRGSWNLHSMRAWVSCSEPVRYRSMLEFLSAFEDWGVRAGSLQASYAMAETVFAISQTAMGQIPRTIGRDQVSFVGPFTERLTFTVNEERLVSSGQPLPETKVRIVGAQGEPCPDGFAGEVEIQCPSLFAGYWGREGFRGDCFSLDGWYRTGDSGFLKEGEIFVIGRLKDLIIVGGQNVFPEDIEAIVNEVHGVYPGRVVAFAMEDDTYGTQSIAVIAEMRGDGGTSSDLEKEIRARVLTGIGIAPRYVKAVPERWIVKSTAGKISRKESREKFLRDFVQDVTPQMVSQ